jgi:hypothetical protein
LSALHSALQFLNYWQQIVCIDFKMSCAASLLYQVQPTTRRKMMNNASVYDLQGQQQVLGTLLARGGEGEVYPLVARPEIFAHRLPQNGNEI